MPVTPYVVGQWVRGEKFYGRGRILEEILEGNRNCVWLLGTRRIGKTSILKELEHVTSLSPERGYFSLFWDFQGAEEPENLHEGFGEALLDAFERLSDRGIPPERVQAEDLFESISRLRRELRSKNLKLLLLCDEVEELVQINERSPGFLRRLRRALQSAENIRTVFASKIKLWDLANEDTSTSPFLHGFTPPLFVNSLTDDESRSLIRQSKLPEDSRPGFDEATVEAIRAHCNNHPYLLQLLGERLLSFESLERAIEEIATDEMVRHFFAVDFAMLTETERNLIRIIASEREKTSAGLKEKLARVASSLNGDLSRLEHLGFIRRGPDGAYSLANFFFERWFRELPSIERAHRPDRGARAALEPTLQEPSSDVRKAEPLRCIDDRYELLLRLGSGASGEVFKAHDTLLGTVIAIKLLKPEYCSNKDAAVRLNREVILSRDLTHPNILKIYHLGDDHGQKYVTMQYVDGPNLAEVISREAPFTIERAVAITRTLAAALSVAHKGKVLHRDIKPANILMDGAGEPHIADFGLARLLDGPDVTRDGTFLGTPVYASPEQIRGESLDERSDLYALGVVTFEMVTGRRPGRDDARARALEPESLRPGVPNSLSELILRCLAADPEERFRDAGELTEALDALAAE